MGEPLLFCNCYSTSGAQPNMDKNVITTLNSINIKNKVLSATCNVFRTCYASPAVIRETKTNEENINKLGFLCY